jgi:FkbM family methyltransferase
MHIAGGRPPSNLKLLIVQSGYLVHDMKAALRSLLLRLSNGARVQRLLERGVAEAHFLMGIGSGAAVASSGERTVIERLRARACNQHSLCVFDVGANQGQFLQMLQQAMKGSAFHVHVFEPGREAYRALGEVCCKYENVTVNNLALGKTAGVADLHYDRPGSGMASMSKRNVEHLGIRFAATEKVNVETLDSYCIRHRIESIDLLKMDVEGHELDVLAGGIAMLQRSRIRMVMFEFGGCNVDSRTYFRDFYYFFREHGFKALFRIAPSGYLAPIRRYDEALEQFGTTNYVALAEDW